MGYEECSTAVLGIAIRRIVLPSGWEHHDAFGIDIRDLERHLGAVRRLHTLCRAGSRSHGVCIAELASSVSGQRAATTSNIQCSNHSCSGIDWPR